MMPLEKKLSLAFSLSALAILALALWQAYAPYAGRVQDVQAIRASITPIAPSGIAAKLRKEPHPPTLLYVYASWCGKCALVMPQLAGIIREHEHDDVRFLFVSTDKSEIDLMDYLVRNRYDGLFTPYILRESADDRLGDALAGFGADYPGAIPYLAFFDRNGTLAADLATADRDAILAALARIRE